MVAELIKTAEACGVDVACLPHLRALAGELTDGKPSTAVDPDMHAVWREAFRNVVAMMPVLLQEALVVADGPRFYGAVIVFLEAVTEDDNDSDDVLAIAMAILNDTRKLDQALRDLRGARTAARRMRDEAKLAAAAQVAQDPALVAEIDEMDRLIVDELAVAVPLPVSAQREAPSCASINFQAAGSVQHVAALYRCWAQREGWVIDDILDNDRHVAVTVRRPDSKLQFELRIGHWIFGRVTLAIEFPHEVNATILPGKRHTSGCPAPPPITRERLPALPPPATEIFLDSPEALLADGGLLFVSQHEAIWMIDPHAKTKTLVASLPRTRVRGLVALDDGTILGFSALPITLYRLPAGSTIAVTTNSTYGRALARIGDVAYVLSDSGRLIEVTLSTGAIADIADFTIDGSSSSSLAAVGGTLYIAHDKLISAVDPITHAVRELIELPKAALYLASDDVSLFTAHSRALGRIDPITRTFEQIAGQPQLGDGQILDMSGGRSLDGPREAAVIDKARLLSHDAGNLWFTDNSGLRRFNLASRHLATLDFA